MSPNILLLKLAKRYPTWIVLTIVLGFSGALFNGVSTALIVPVLLSFLDQQSEFDNIPPILRALLSPFELVEEQYRLPLMLVTIVFVIALKNLSSYASSLVSSALGRALTRELRETGMELLLQVDLDFYSKMRVGDLINRLGSEIGRTASAIGTAIGLLTTSVTVLIFLGILVSLSWQLTIASTFLLLILALVNQYAISRSKYFGQQLSETSKAYSIRVLEVLSGIRLVKSTGNEDREYELIRQLIREREKVDFQSQANYAAIAPMNEVSSIIALILIVLLGRAFFADQLETLSTVLLTYLLVLFRVLPMIGSLNSSRSKFANSSAGVEVVYDFLRRDNKPFMPNGKEQYQGLREKITFEQLSFSYSNNENEMVLRGINLELPRGTTLALVGASGAGKSTMADLLPRFYDPTAGRITIDGKDLRDFEVQSLRKAMGIVSQETFLFNDSLRNNIAYACLGATDDEVIEAAKRANAYEFISQLPQGLDTMIGDRGVLLSGGQRQRIAIARALLQNPEILVLDEATSALDTVSERLVQKALDDLSRDRTTLVIAHRLSTVQNAHQIAVLDKGQVVEVGTHSELLSKGGYYSRLYDIQFSKDGPNGKAQKMLEATRGEILTHTSHQMRNRLNSMIGSLGLVVDGFTDSSEEQEEFTKDAYHSAIYLLKTVEALEENTKKMRGE